MGLDPITAGIGGSVISGLFGASSAKKAAKQQAAQAERDLQFQTETRDLIRGDLSGYRGAGTNALDVYNFEMGLGAAPMMGGSAPTIETIGGQMSVTGRPDRSPGRMWGGGRGARGDGGPTAQGGAAFAPQTPQQFRVNGQTFNTYEDALAYANANKAGGKQYGGYSMSPDYKYRMDQGLASVNALAGARGGLVSGRTMQDLFTTGSGIAAQGRGEYLSRLGGLIDTGMSAAQMSGQASQNAAAGASNAFSGIGNAQSAGTIGAANAFSGATNNLIGLYGYQSAMKNPQTYNPIQNHRQTGQGF